MRPSVSYYIDLGSLEYDRYIELKTIKQVDNQIKKLIDNKQSFMVYVKFNYPEQKYMMSRHYQSEIWQYSANEDRCWRFNLHKNTYLKRLRQCTNRLKKTMLSHGR